jgi:hypothetical protein
MCTACGKLSRGKAKEEIIKYYKLPYTETVELNKKFFNGHEFQGGLETMCMRIGDKSYITFAQQLDVMVKAGFITLSESYDYNCHDKYIDVTLTEKGKQDMVEDKDGVYVIKLCTIEFEEVTGIVEYKGLNAADVNCTLVRTNITEFGRMANNVDPYDTDKKIKEKIGHLLNFRKYDDGWRLGQ